MTGERLTETEDGAVDEGSVLSLVGLVEVVVRGERLTKIEDVAVVRGECLTKIEEEVVDERNVPSLVGVVEEVAAEVVTLNRKSRVSTRDLSRSSKRDPLVAVVVVVERGLLAELVDLMARTSIA